MRRSAVSSIVIVAVTAASVLVAAPAHAGTHYSWVGGHGTAWGTAENWSPQEVPDDGDSVDITANQQDCSGAHIEGVPTIELQDMNISDVGPLGGTCTVVLTGGTVTIDGIATLDGGWFRTPLVFGSGALASVSPSHQTMPTFDAAVDVQGSLTLQGANESEALKITAGHTLHISPGGAVESLGDNDITYTTCCVTPAHITNEGTLTAWGGTLTVEAVELDQLGTMNVTDGTLLTRKAPVTTQEGSAYEGNGTWSIQEGATGYFAGKQTLGKDFHIRLGGDNTGTSEAIGGTFALDGKGTFDWDGGTIEGNVTVGHKVTVALTGKQDTNDRRFLWGQDYTVGSQPVAATFTNHGTVALSKKADLYTEYTADLVNASDGTLSFTPNTKVSAYTCCDSPDRIDNHGALRLAAGLIARPVDLHNLLYAQSSGTTTLGPRTTLQTSLPVAFRAGRLQGSGTVDAPSVTNSRATLVPGMSGTGTLKFTGTYTQGARAELDLDLTDKSIDKVVVVGEAGMKGTLRVHNYGKYKPEAGAQRTVVAAPGGISGGFTCVTTSGTGSTGKGARHWVAKFLAGAVNVLSKPGRKTDC